MGKGVYVAGMAQVSSQQPLSDEWFVNPVLPSGDYVRALEPDTKGVIPPGEARRMSRILKRSVCTAMEALKRAGISDPDAIITGTGMGCMENSEKFLADLIKYGENCLKPTLFMQSTHNTISSLIAIMLKCHGYNNTYSQRAISFESALLDAWLGIKGGMFSTALVGAHDEVTPLLAKVMKRTQPEYKIISETSVSVALSGVKESGDENGSTPVVEVEDVRLFHNPDEDVMREVLDEEHDGVIITGLNGNERNDFPYFNIFASLPYNPVIVRYKHIFGENYSSPAIAFYTGVRILERGFIPIFMTDMEPEAGVYEDVGKEAEKDLPKKELSRITLLNHSDGMDWSIIRLKLCGN